MAKQQRNALGRGLDALLDMDNIQTEGSSSINEIEQESGFLIAPFHVSDDCPIVLILPDEIHSLPLPENTGEHHSAPPSTSPVAESYLDDFTCFHGAVREGRFSKLVLAHSLTQSCLIRKSDLRQLFIRTCMQYPDFMVMLFSTPQTGQWLVASPEVLVEGHDTVWHTIAMAGTMALHESALPWSDKNREEQRLVESFVRNTLERLASDISSDGPRSFPAGHIRHLRTDFRFTTEAGRLGELISALHPTPAVSGLPRGEAVSSGIKAYIEGDLFLAH